MVRGIEEAVEELVDKEKPSGEPSEREQEIEELGDGTEQVRHDDFTDQAKPTLLRRYREAVELAWADGELNRQEAEWLNGLANSKLELSPSTAADIEREVMGDTKEAILERQKRAALDREEEERRNRLDKLYAEARRSHQNQEWQAVIDLFDRIRTADPEYLDREGLLVSAREALVTQAQRELADRSEEAGDDHREEIDFQEADRRYVDLKQQYDNGSLGAEEFDALLHQLMVEDAGGRWWSKHPETGEWHYHDGTTWVWRTPPSYTRPPSQAWRELADGTDQRAATTTITPANAGQVQLLRTLEGHEGEVNAVAFSPDGRLLASGAEDKKVRLWRVGDGALLHTLGHTDWVNAVAFSPDGQLLASGAGDRTVGLWRVGDRALRRTLGHEAKVNSVAFSLDGRLVASGTDDEKVRLWRVGDGALLRTLKGHTSSVSTVAFSPNGQLLAPGSKDMTVRLWRIA